MKSSGVKHNALLDAFEKIVKGANGSAWADERGLLGFYNLLNDVINVT